ncbi:MAG TPA: A24 family peptidase [Gaiellaceae bacterium]|jgi:leader peptidase (prepilin peptidase)/N-methyltransferase
MSSVPTPVSEPPTQPEPAAEPAEVERQPLAELLPTGTLRVAVVTATIGLAVASFVSFGFGGKALLGAVFCPTLALLAAIDARHRLLPNAIILPATLAIGLIVAAYAPGSFLTHLAAAAALGGFFFLFGTIFAGSLGMGDAKLGFMIGLALGAQTLGAALIAFAGLLVAALYVLATRGTSARKDAIPFGPFLALGGILAFFLS